MAGGGVVRRVEFAVAGIVGCVLLAGCGGTSGFEPARESSYSLGSIGSSLGNLIAFNKLFPGAAPLPQTDAPVECPTVEVQDGTASYRVYKGADQANENVRYGFALGDVARDCSKAGDKIALRVGTEGRVLIGPAGGPGTFTVPIRIAVRNDVTQKLVTSMLARVSATVGPDQTQAAFSYVSEPFTVPFVAHPDEDYSILVGIDPKGQDVGAAPAPRRKKPQR